MHRLLQCLSSIATLLLLLCLTSHTALATTAVVPADEDMVAESRAIVTGSVEEMFAAANSQTEVVYTFVTIRIEAVIKGTVRSQVITLKEVGGEVEGHGTLLYGMPRFEVGQQVLLFLDTWPDGSLRVRHGFLGKFNVEPDLFSGQLMVSRETEGAGVSLLPQTQGPHTEQAEFNSYTSMLLSLVNKTAARSFEFESSYYAGAPLLETPPALDKPPEGSEYRPMWTYIDPSRPLRWFQPDSGAPVTFYVNTANAPISSILDCITAAMSAWSSAPGSSIRLSYAGPTSGCGINTTDGKNTISFNNCDGYFSASASCSGLLAVGGIIRYTTETRNVGGVTYNKGLEGRVSFNPYAFCQFANPCDIQEVATHEIGHALGLGHSTDTSAVMYAYAHFDGRCAMLSSDDIAGIAAIYPGVRSGSLAISTGPTLPAADSNADYMTRLEVSGGAGGYEWSMTGGQLPAGLLFSPSGLIYGKTGSASTFNFAAKVKDSIGSTATRTFSLEVKPPPPPPEVTGAEYKKKKVTVYGLNFSSESTVYIDGVKIGSKFDGTMLKTKKKKQEPGMHTVRVVNPDGGQSNEMQFEVP